MDDKGLHYVTYHVIEMEKKRYSSFFVYFQKGVVGEIRGLK